MVNCCTTTTNLDSLVFKFWKLEEISRINTMSKKDEECENHFKLTFQCYTNGQYNVCLPFKVELLQYNNSYNLVVKQLKKVEKISTMTKLNKSNLQSVMFIPHCHVNKSISYHKYQTSGCV